LHRQHDDLSFGCVDMRAVVARSAQGDDAAALALDVDVHHLRSGIAAMAAGLGALDVLVFTGGVGEDAAEIRARAAAGRAFRGVGIDGPANAVAAPDADIGLEHSPSAHSRTSTAVRCRA
jgi:acetate kinase